MDIDKLKANPRFWSDQGYRRTVLAYMWLTEVHRRNVEIVKRVLSLQEQQEALTKEFLLLNRD